MRREDERNKKTVESCIHLSIVYNIGSSIYIGEVGLHHLYVIINIA